MTLLKTKTRFMHLAYFLFFSLLLNANAFSQDSSKSDKQLSVLVTGTSTGIGRNLAEKLATSGYHVYAGARKDADLAMLNSIENITAVRLDVTKQAQIDAVVELIKAKGTGLYGLVNNAGIGDWGNVLDTPVSIHNLVYSVNVEGVYRVTKAFAPLIIESEGRIMTTGSIAGTLSWADGNAYAGSKHWIEAFTDALADEMRKHKVSVSVIQPGNYQTNIRRSAALRQQARVLDAGGKIDEKMKDQYEATVKRELSYKLPDDVTKAYMHALFDDKPLRRYMVVPEKSEQAMTINTKIQQLVQLNEWGEHTYSDEELVNMLKSALESK
jgi:NAD(P)-dependent dehydrogenase (short-subunit alcohol dehydrogenase family)